MASKHREQNIIATAKSIARYRARRYWGFLRERAPDDWAQCVAIGESVGLTEMNRELAALARSLGFHKRAGSMEIRSYDIVPGRRSPNLRPSKLKRRTGYRHDSARRSQDAG